MVVADREGFEPSVRFHVHTLSKRARSTTPPPVRSTSLPCVRQLVYPAEEGLILQAGRLGKG